MKQHAKSGLELLADLSYLALLAYETKSLRDYGRRVRGLVTGYWRGSINKSAFKTSMRRAIDRGITQAFYEGAREVGITPEEMSVAENRALLDAIEQTLISLDDFAEQIAKGSRAKKGKLKPLLNRAKMWTNRYLAVRGEASALVGTDKKLEWIWNPEKEHCDDCRRMNGRVYRASIWAKNNLRPQSHDLQCGGWLCGCEFVVTDKPFTLGRPPKLRGR